MSGNTKCRTRNCRNFPDGFSKSCADCKEEGRRRTAKYRAKQAESDKANLEVLGLSKLGRGPNRPKPPLFRVRLPDKGVMLCTRRDWEHLDKTYFQDDLDTEFSPSSRDGEIELIPIKICTRWSCYQPLPASHPKTSCGLCSQKSSRNIIDKNGAKKKSLDQIVSSLTSEDSEIRRAASDYLRRRVPKDSRLEISRETLNVLIKLLDDREKDLSNLALATLSSCYLPPYRTETRKSLTRLLQLLHDTETDHSSVLNILGHIADDDDIDICPSLPRIIELANDYPCKVASILSSFAQCRPYYEDIGTVITCFTEMLVVANKALRDDIGNSFFLLVSSIGTYQEDIVRTLPILIDRLCDCNYINSYSRHVAYLVKNLARNNSYHKEIAAAIAKINELLVIADGDKFGLVNVLSTLSESQTYHGDITPSLPRLRDLLSNADKYTTSNIHGILANLSDNAEYHHLTSVAIPAVVDLVSKERIHGRFIQDLVSFILSHSTHTLIVGVIEQVIPQIVRLLGGEDYYDRWSASATLLKIYRQNMYHTSIYNAIPEIVRGISSHRFESFDERLLEELSKDEHYRARITELASHSGLNLNF